MGTRRRIATIGVYGASQASFLAALAAAGVSVLLDVRQRRGVRGPQYAWANSRRLQDALAEVGIVYRHLKDLAPTTELRTLQYVADDAAGVGKRSRSELAAAYIAAYEREILDSADLEELFASLPSDQLCALFCVERDAHACHRSLIAGRLVSDYGYAVTNLRA